MMEIIDEKLDYQNRVILDNGIVENNTCINYVYKSNEVFNLTSNITTIINLNSFI
jgi:hypothetical protein